MTILQNLSIWIICFQKSVNTFSKYSEFSLPNPEECEQFIIKKLGLKFEDFEKISELPEFFTEFGPNTWPPEYYDPLWDLSKTDKSLLCTTDRLIVYAPDKNRFYYHY